MNPVQLAPSILSADLGHLADEVRAVEAAGADIIHVDVMDGHFVPNIAIGPGTVRAVRAACSLPIDTHLMVRNPLDCAGLFIDAGATMVSFHIEACPTPFRALERIRDMGARAGIVFNPGTPVSMLEEAMDAADYILALCVEPGFGNQALRVPVLDKIRRLRRLQNERNIHVPIQVDGGINADTITAAAVAGAENFVVGSAIFESPDCRTSVGRLKELAGGALQRA